MPQPIHHCKVVRAQVVWTTSPICPPRHMRYAAKKSRESLTSDTLPKLSDFLLELIALPPN